MSFDTLAPFYRSLEWLVAGPLLHRCRTAFLSQISRAQNALLLGEGPGRFLVELLRVNPSVDVTCLDSSAGMIRAAQRGLRSQHLDQRAVRFVQMDCTRWSPPSGAFDLIATHFFLDCFPPEQLATLIPRVRTWAAPYAFWLLSDFQEPPAGWQRLRARVVLKLAYQFFRWTTRLAASHLTPPGPFLQAAGFRLHERRTFHHGLLYAELWQLAPPQADRS